MVVDRSSTPLLLALDTATAVASIALFDGWRLLAESTWLAGREHSTHLLPEVERMFTRVGTTVAQVTGIVVAMGPGSFTGVRVALSVGKGLAAGLSIPMWGVSTLDVLARQAGPTDLPVRPLLDVGRGRFATALYVRDRVAEPMRGVRIDGVVEILRDWTVVVGDLAPEDRERLVATQRAVLVTPAQSVRRAGTLAELGWAKALAGEPGDPAEADALYLPAGA